MAQAQGLISSAFLGHLSASIISLILQSLWRNKSVQHKALVHFAGNVERNSVGETE
jgi:hypothetical protein